MSLQIKLQKSGFNVVDNRFETLYWLYRHIWNMFDNNIINKKILLFYDAPSIYADENNILKDYNEETFQKLIKKAKKESFLDKRRLGFKIYFDFTIKKFEESGYIILFPFNDCLREAFDIELDILEPKNESSISDYIKKSLNIKNKLAKLIKNYQKFKEKNILKIKKAISINGDNFDDVKAFSYVYYSNPKDFYLDCIRTSKYEKESVFKSKFYIADENKIASLINASNPIVLHQRFMFKNCNVLVESGSLSLIPKEDNSMKLVYGIIRDKFLKRISEELPSKQEIEENFDNIRLK